MKSWLICMENFVGTANRKVHCYPLRQMRVKKKYLHSPAQFMSDHARFFSTPFNKYFLREKERRSLVSPTQDEETLENLFDLARRTSRFEILVSEQRDFMPRLFRLFTSSQTSVRYKAIKFFSSMPEDDSFLECIETDVSLRDILPSVLENIYSFATDPERPFSRKKAIALHLKSISVLIQCFGKTHPNVIMTMYRLAIMYMMNVEYSESSQWFNEAVLSIFAFQQRTCSNSLETYNKDFTLMLQHATIFHDFAKFLIDCRSKRIVMSQTMSVENLCHEAMRLCSVIFSEYPAETASNNISSSQLTEEAKKLFTN
jgi:hypothetical protein